MPAEKFGKYSLLHKLATGGMGEVWLARQSGPAGFDRFIAVKRLLPNLAENNEFVQMFLDEARLAAKLNHPNICQVYEFGREGGTYYLAMEYLHGESLSSMLERSIKERKPMSQPVVAYVVAQALEGLHFAHEAKDEHGKSLGLVHRDISPSNIFVTYDGQVKLLDFGIAKAANRQTQTVVGSIKGKFGYIAPEVYKGLSIDRRVDLFAMGVVLWEMLTRRRLYKRAAEYEILRAIVEEEPPDPRSLDTAVAPELSAATLKALAKPPGDRYQTALEMRRAISVFLRSLHDEMDPQAMASVMANLYGQVWIDLRSSVLESFKDASGSVVNAEALNATRTDSQISQIVAGRGAIADGPNFSHQVQGQPRVRTASRSASRPASSASAARFQTPQALPPAPALTQTSRTPYLVGSAVTLIALISVAAFAARWRQAPDPLPPEPAEPGAQRELGLKRAEAPPILPSVAAPAPTAAAAPANDPTGPGTLLVTARPSSALVQVDDLEEKRVPSTWAALTPGRHRVRVHAVGYETRTEDIVINSNQMFNIDADLQVKTRQHAKAAPPSAGKSAPKDIRADDLMKAF